MHVLDRDVHGEQAGLVDPVAPQRQLRNRQEQLNAVLAQPVPQRRVDLELQQRLHRNSLPAPLSHRSLLYLFVIDPVLGSNVFERSHAVIIVRGYPRRKAVGVPPFSRRTIARISARHHALFTGGTDPSASADRETCVRASEVPAVKKNRLVFLQLAFAVDQMLATLQRIKEVAS